VSRERRAGIAQLVEQATENRRVPSSNLGPGMLNHPFRIDIVATLVNCVDLWGLAKNLRIFI
jgi:hypothetical protein